MPVSESQFQQARDIAYQASELDFAKNSFPPEHQNAAITTVREMHKLAQALAEDRQAELYVPSNWGQA
jgi:hypothetical protein